MDEWNFISRRLLTGKQEAFCLKVACERMNQSAAYRAVYSMRLGKSATIHTSASRLAKEPRIAARIAELKAEVLAEALELYARRPAAMSEADKAYRAALTKGRVGAALRALAAKSKQAGLLD